jgi:hypothetical protein
MKSFNVKSNAKRFARGIAAKHPDHIEVIEPVEIEDGAREWYPAIRIIGEVCDSFRVMVFDSYGAIAVIHGLDTGEVANEEEAAAVLTEEVAKHCVWVDDETGEPVNDASGLKAAFDTVEPLTTGDLESVAEPLVFDAATIASRPELAKLAAELPPPVVSTREEIDARRALRRQRIEGEKNAGTRDTRGNKVEAKKISKKKIVLDLMRRDDGATQAELETATGWQRHTLRGYIAGTLRKQLGAVGYAIECERGRGDVPTRYFVAKVSEGGEA